MSNGILFFAFLMAGIVLGILYNKFRIKNYPENKQKSGYFLAIIMFVGASLSIYIITSFKSYLDQTIINYSVTIEEYIDEKYSDNEIVKNGVTINQLNEIIVHITSGKNVIMSILPNELDNQIGKFVYGICVNYIGGYIDDFISKNAIDNYANAIKIYADENDIFTVSSMINGLRVNLLNKINQILLIILIVINIPFYIYLISTIIIKIKTSSSRNISSPNCV